jgi:GAF domain-containing protein
MISEKQKTARYKRLKEQASELLANSPSRESAFATLNALLYHKVSYIFWVGIYLMKDDKLIVNAYQGPLACQVLPFQRGICWQSVMEETSIIVPDVHKVPEHIACDSRSKSEIVIPLRDSTGKIYGVLDVDSEQLNTFSEADRIGLEGLVELVVSS